MHDVTEKKELSSLFIFVPLVVIAVYFVYLFVTIPFQYGREQGVIKAAYAVPKKDDGTEAEVFDHQKLVKPSEELITLGGKIYDTQCASCHGKEGYGDGTAGQRLTVKPRNFHEDGPWKNGKSVIAMYGTLDVGLGGVMPAFPALNPKQRYAVIHYVHNAFMQTNGWPEPTEAERATLPAPSAGGVSISIDPYSETRVAVGYAMQKLAEPARETASRGETNLPGGLGKEIYTANCMGCHGPNGEGVAADSRLMTLRSLRELAWGSSLLEDTTSWAEDPEAFRTIIVEGQPEGIKPGFPMLTDEELEALYRYTLALRGKN